jgi:hypothetical protein
MISREMCGSVRPDSLVLCRFPAEEMAD